MQLTILKNQTQHTDFKFKAATHDTTYACMCVWFYIIYCIASWWGWSLLFSSSLGHWSLIVLVQRWKTSNTEFKLFLLLMWACTLSNSTGGGHSHPPTHTSQWSHFVHEREHVYITWLVKTTYWNFSPIYLSHTNSSNQNHISHLAPNVNFCK